MSDFEAVAQKLKDEKPKLSNDQLLKLYGLYKQALNGDNTVAKPGLMSGFEARGKWDAYEANKGMS